jgi:hypothetical protein
MFPLVRNLSKKLLRFHYPTWLHTNPFFRSSFPRPLIVQESIKATSTNKYLPFGKKTTSGHHKFLYRNQLLGPEKEKRERERDGCYLWCCPKWIGIFVLVWREEESSLVGNWSNWDWKLLSWCEEVDDSSCCSTKEVLDPCC